LSTGFLLFKHLEEGYNKDALFPLHLKPHLLGYKKGELNLCRYMRWRSWSLLLRCTLAGTCW
jgi:hypothetical protein